MKRCSRCREERPRSGFYTNPGPKDGLASWCKVCSLADARRSALKRQYGLSLEEFDAMLREQDGVCAACGQPEVPGRNLAIDHDHACCPARARSCGQCIRALLCRGCNIALGGVGDSIERLWALISYLEAHL